MPSPVSLHIDPRMAAYGFMRGSAPGGRHTLSADRFAAFYKEALARGLDRKVEVIAASPRATQSELTLFHDAAYVEHVRARCVEGTGTLNTGGLPAERGMDVIASAVVGAVLHAGKRVVAGDTRRAFVPIAGFHHAQPGEARDHCIYNDAAILLTYLKKALPMPRLAYVDMGARYGDGAIDAFEADPQVAILDIHQDARSFWSAGGDAVERGTDRAESAWIHMLPANAGDEAVLEVWPRMLAWLQDYRPDCVVFVASADGLRDDGIGGLAFTTALHRRLTTDLAALADRFGHGRMIVLGGAGYALGNLGPCWCEVIDALLAPTEATAPTVTPVSS